MKKYFLFAVFLLLADTPAWSQDMALFQDRTILKAVLTAPISQVYSQKKQDVRLYFPGRWTYVDSDGSTQRLDVSIRTRGNFRRLECSLPPLQLNFKKKQVQETLFEGQDKIKLVGQCKTHDSYQQLLLLEYLAYRAFEVVSEYHFRTRLLQLSHIDSDENRKPRTSFSFLIEEENKMAERLGMTTLDVPYAMPQQFDPARTAIVEIFQLMIGNTDYSALRGPEGDNCCHNIQLISTGNSGQGIIPVPYDFDTSGLVNAKYALPPESLPIRNVRTRYFHRQVQGRATLGKYNCTIQRKKERRNVCIFRSRTPG